MKKELTAYCGLDCETCDARLATIRDDAELRRKTADLWTELNGVEIAPEDINCLGCRVDGPKTPFCESLCPIRQCALRKGVETCGECSMLERCDFIRMITDNNEEAYRRLRE